MLRKLQAFFVMGVWVVAIPAAAQESTDEPSGKPSAQAGTASAASEESAPKPEE